MKICIVTDAWHPQVNGVVRTLETTASCLREFGHDVTIITPEFFRTMPCPTYPSIQLALLPKKKLTALIDAFQPDAIHIATEGPLGLAARAYCQRRKFPFTTSFHTQFPEYLRARAPIPLALSYAALRHFHHGAVRTLVPTPSQIERLSARGFKHLQHWSRGVNSELFVPGDKQFIDAPRPISMYMGRVAVEKNIEAFLSLDLPGTQYVVGDGPDLEKLKRQFPQAVFVGAKFGQELAQWLAAADVFVFPSLTDTFGLVLLEALACGVPVAAFPVTGPIDIIQNGVTGVLDQDLRQAILKALTLNSADCVAYAKSRTWQACSKVFQDMLEPITPSNKLLLNSQSQ